MSLRLGPARGVGDAPVLRRQRAATVELVERLERLKKEDAAGLRVHLLLQSGCAPLTFLLVSTCASRERMWELLTLVALSYGERRAESRAAAGRARAARRDAAARQRVVRFRMIAILAHVGRDGLAAPAEDVGHLRGHTVKSE